MADEQQRSLRALGVDLGTKRIGVALSDSAGTMALPYEVVTRCGDEATDHRRILALAAEAEVETIVVGLPLSLDGREGPAARSALDEAARLASVAGVPVVTFDERLTTVTAQRDLRQAQMGGRAQRKVIDKVAAAVLLQHWLDGQRRQRGIPGGAQPGGGSAEEHQS